MKLAGRIVAVIGDVHNVSDFTSWRIHIESVEVEAETSRGRVRFPWTLDGPPIVGESVSIEVSQP